MSSALLPSNATPLERALCDATGRATALPVERIATLWNPWTCPAGILPHLAWSLHVDDWDSAWTEHQRRAAIAASIQVHRTKGAIGALRRALSALGYEVTINEDTGQAYTFRLAINAGERGIEDTAVHAEAARIALANKNARSRLLGIDTLAESPRATVRILTASISGESTTILPQLITSITNTGTLTVALAYHNVETVTVYPTAREAIEWGDGAPMLWADDSPVTI